MKYSEFKRLVEKSGNFVVKNEKVLGRIIVREIDTRNLILTISNNSQFGVNSRYMDFIRITDQNKEKLLDLAVQLASTPLNEREDEKRYRLRLPFAVESRSYLNTCSDMFFVSSKANMNDYKTIFTESEIEELKRKYNLDSFVLEEVKEDE